MIPKLSYMVASTIVVLMMWAEFKDAKVVISVWVGVMTLAMLAFWSRCDEVEELLEELT